MSQAARALRAIQLYAQSKHLRLAIRDIEAEDAEQAAQANTPEAYAAKEQWVRTICRKEIAKAFRDVANDPENVGWSTSMVSMKAVADKLDPPAPEAPSTEEPFNVRVCAKCHQGCTPRNVPHDVGLGERMGQPICTACGNLLKATPLSEPEPPLGPGDVMRYGQHADGGRIVVYAVLGNGQFIDSDGAKWDRSGWYRVALAEIEPGMAVEVVIGSIVRGEGVCIGKDGPVYTVAVWCTDIPSWNKIGYGRCQLRLLKALEEGKA